MKSYVLMSTASTTYSAHATGLAFTGEKYEKITVKMKSGRSDSSLRFWLIDIKQQGFARQSEGRLVEADGGLPITRNFTFYRYKNGTMTNVHYPRSSMADLGDTVPDDLYNFDYSSLTNAMKPRLLSEMAMTRAELESIPANELNKIIEAIGSERDGFVYPDAIRLIRIMVEWTGETGDAFPIDKIIIKRTRNKTGGRVVYPVYKMYSPTYKLRQTKNINKSDFVVDGDGNAYKFITNYAPTGISEMLSAGLLLQAALKNSNGVWSQWIPVNALPDFENITAVKLQASFSVTDSLQYYGIGNDSAYGDELTSTPYLGPISLQSVTFSPADAQVYFTGKTLITKQIKLLNPVKKVNATLVHYEDVTLRPYITLRNIGTKITNEVLATGNGERQSVYLRNITGLTNEGFKLYFNGVEQEISSYSLSTRDGLVTFTASNGIRVTADYYYNAGIEEYQAMTRVATYRNESRPEMIETQYTYESNVGGDVAVFKCDIEGEGEHGIEKMSLFFHE